MPCVLFKLNIFFEFEHMSVDQLYIIFHKRLQKFRLFLIFIIQLSLLANNYQPFCVFPHTFVFATVEIQTWKKEEISLYFITKHLTLILLDWFFKKKGLGGGGLMETYIAMHPLILSGIYNWNIIVC